MRVLLDTNVVLSALLFPGPPRRLLRILSSPPFELWTSRPLLRELAATLAYRKLAAAVARTGLSVEGLVESYASQTLVVPDEELTSVPFPADPSDAAVVAAARAARVEWLVTGDRHLLDARQPTSCLVLRVTEALARATDLSARG
jgi:putative PIN family toxin of toxin-antitoxin system